MDRRTHKVGRKGIYVDKLHRTEAANQLSKALLSTKLRSLPARDEAVIGTHGHLRSHGYPYPSRPSIA